MKSARLATLAGYVALCLVLDLYPRYGRPAFRYTGSDPSIPVWNLGWPMALAIHDARSGFHAGPSAYLIVPGQIFVLGILMTILAVVGPSRSVPPGGIGFAPARALAELDRR